MKKKSLNLSEKTNIFKGKKFLYLSEILLDI